MHKITVSPATLGGWREREGVTASERPMRYSPLDPSRTALVVVDMQNGFCTPGQPTYLAPTSGIIANINRLAGAVRKAGGQVVWLLQTYRNSEPRFALPAWRRECFPRIQQALEANFAQGSVGYQLHPDMDVAAQDLRIDKTRWGAMAPNSSTLHETLQGLGIDTFIAVGCASDVCVATTVCEAAMLDYKTIFVMDATATDSDEAHNATIAGLNHMFLIDLVTTDTLLEQLKAPALAD